MVTTDQQSNPTGSTTDPLAVFRRFPTSLVVFLGLLVAGGAALSLTNLGKAAVAKCGADLMAAGDICSLRGRRSRTTTEWTYQERLDFNQAENASLVWAGLAIALVAVVMIVLSVIRWRQDMAIATQLAGQQAPLAAYAKATGALAGLGALVAAAAGGVGALLLVRAFAGKGSPVVGVVIGVVAFAFAIALLWAARPKGCTLVWAYQPAVRIVTRSKINDIAWHDMHYLTTLGSPAATSLAWVGRKDNLSIDDNDFFATMRSQINNAVRAVVPQRVGSGEVIDFGKVTVAGPTLTIGKKSVPGTDLAGITVVRDKNGTYFEFRDHQGKAIGSVPVQDVANIDVLFELLAQQFNARIAKS